MTDRQPSSPAGRKLARRMRGLLMALYLGVPAQAASQQLLPLRAHASLSSESIRVHRGDATVGPVSSDGWLLAVGVRTASVVGAEVFRAFSSRDTDPYARSPELSIVGSTGTLSLGRAPLPTLTLGLGLASTAVRGWPDFSGCRPENGCFAEGGPGFRDGNAWSPVFGAGVSYTVLGHVLVRADARYVASSEVSNQWLRWVGLGAGVVVP